MTEAIKTMKLYSQVERIHNDLASVGIGREDPLSLDVLTRFDQLHYHGTDAVDEAIRRLDLGPADSVLDIGAGFGGPARYLGATSGARVTAVELQPDLDATGADLTRRTGLDDRVTHICGDIHTVPLEPGSHTAAVSYLALYHIPDRPRVFRRLSAALAGGGRIYIEDLYLRQPLNDYEARMMREDLFGNTMAER
ncbi:MAG: class I SAM-dependent methyltransferase, partial [Pseudomonadota bacterium]